MTSFSRLMYAALTASCLGMKRGPGKGGRLPTEESDQAWKSRVIAGISAIRGRPQPPSSRDVKKFQQYLVGKVSPDDLCRIIPVLPFIHAQGYAVGKLLGGGGSKIAFEAIKGGKRDSYVIRFIGDGREIRDSYRFYEEMNILCRRYPLKKYPAPETILARTLCHDVVILKKEDPCRREMWFEIQERTKSFEGGAVDDGKVEAWEELKERTKAAGRRHQDDTYRQCGFRQGHDYAVYYDWHVRDAEGSIAELTPDGQKRQRCCQRSEESCKNKLCKKCKKCTQAGYAYSSCRCSWKDGTKKYEELLKLYDEKQYTRLYCK